MNLQSAYRSIDASTLPTTDQLGLLAQGDHVQLRLENGSSFWAQVDQVRKDGTFRGVSVDTVNPVQKGSWVIFGREHVYNIV